MSKATIMAVMSLFFMFLSMIILNAPKIALIISLVGWFGFGAYSVIILIRDKKRKSDVSK